MVRHDVYDPGHYTPVGQHINGDPCPVEGCDLPIFNRCTVDNVKPCPLGRDCAVIPSRFV